MTYKEALEMVSSRRKFPKKPGLERMKHLLDLIGNPQNKLKFVHVAGTNGKGTTCSYISSVLQESGYKTGLFTSPFVIDFTERFQINSQMIDHEQLIKHVDYVSSFDLGEITEFEFVTAIAMDWFAKQNCDIVVLEVGLGGRFDATNVIENPLVSVITSISLDHTKILGDTVEQIAFEKAGIIKENCPTVCYLNQKDSVIKVIEETCKTKNSKFHLADMYFDILEENINGSKFKTEELEIFIPFCGNHQIYNAITAYETIKILKKQNYNITNENIVKGFRKTKIPARMEVISENPLFILDGGHNIGGAIALESVLKKYLDNKKICGIIGMVEDKDYPDYVKVLAPKFDKIICLEPNDKRALKAEVLAGFARKHCDDVKVLPNACEAIDMALKEYENIVACGSLYLASELRPIITCKLKNL
ncbi:MAG: folylpolyglutamate synthase/dihydrofolate synthase family protein [Clostridia bacterium]